MKKNSKLKILGEYTGHLLLGAAMFVLLLLVSGSAGYVVHFLESIKLIAASHLFAANMVESIIFYCDCGFLIWWSVYSTYKAIKELVNDDNKDEGE